MTERETDFNSLQQGNFWKPDSLRSLIPSAPHPWFITSCIKKTANCKPLHQSAVSLNLPSNALPIQAPSNRFFQQLSQHDGSFCPQTYLKLSTLSCQTLRDFSKRPDKVSSKTTREALVWKRRINYSVMESERNQNGQSQPTVRHQGNYRVEKMLFQRAQ